MAKGVAVGGAFISKTSKCGNIFVIFRKVLMFEYICACVCVRICVCLIDGWLFDQMEMKVSSSRTMHIPYTQIDTYIYLDMSPS